MDQREKKNRIISIYASIGVHAVLLFVFFLMLAWTEPDPPIPEYGIEFNLGESPTDEKQSEKRDNQQVIDEIEEAANEESDASQRSEQNAAREVETEYEETVEDETTEPDIEDINSPDVLEETISKEESKSQKVEETDESHEAGTTTSAETGEKENVKEVQVEEPKIDERAIFKKNEEGAGTGEKGSSLDLTGWDWDFKPKPNDQSTENGIVVFQITIDDEGDIIGIKTLKKTVSPVVEKVYRDAVMELTFSKTSDNRTAAATSTGKITFIIQSN